MVLGEKNSVEAVAFHTAQEIDHLVIDLLAQNAVVVLAGQQVGSGDAPGIADAHEKPNFHTSSSVISFVKAERFPAAWGAAAISHPPRDSPNSAPWFFDA
jgi:hypothetical protein